ncbi:MAG: Thioredoxin reductase [uncultured Sphingomonas sp.]|uniref:Thioredoxin reductase n=1 Tax=uncultured Sphingomonas sp. TaxID=158754 RepID=A0A6J4TI96_9SPHN|nr:cyclic nucleotide-binding domain-containing thioredoxin-disulfide reductase [uncultured Sphingomonas sp.]CAA9522709.1 MAG: Thioredoxin reductase [uncultured Sphingomonas sp.]
MSTEPHRLAEPLDAADPYAREKQTFPILSAEMAGRIARFGAEEQLANGDLLFRRGERSVDFFLVLNGTVDIIDHDERAGERIVHQHHGSQFTGELDLFNDRTILVSGRANGPTRVVRVRRPDFRTMLTAEPDIAEIIMRAFILRRVGLMRHEQGGVHLVGASGDPDFIRVDGFLTRNGYPHIVEPEPGVAPTVLHDGERLVRPSNRCLADRLGLTVPLDPERRYDLAVVGAGPSGLAAAVYAASEGLDTVILETVAPGGQAGTSSKIENYLGFPTGISGQALAGRAQVQAQKFGARLAVARSVERAERDAEGFVLTLDCGGEIRTRAIVAATGARYRKLSAPGIERFEGSGVHYAATAMEANLCAGRPVVIVGGGNSAGQAAVFMAQHVAHVHLLVRGDGLAATMSRYLIDRIDAGERISLHRYCEVEEVGGERGMEWLRWRVRGQEPETVEAAALFVMVGAAPNSEWLTGLAETDDKGFVCTGNAGSPFMTTAPGLFAVGDVRSGSVERVASSVGEGSVVIQFVHRYLEELSRGDHRTHEAQAVAAE